MKQRRLNPAMVPILGLALALAACGNSDGILGVDRGLVQFVLTSGGEAITAVDAGSTVASTSGLLEDGDQPDRYHPFFESANVTFSSILARNLDGVLVDVGMEELPVTVDVMLMDRGRQVVLPDGDLPSATYDQVVVVMTAVQGVTRDGTTITIEPPGGGWTAIVPICPFTVDEGGTTVVGLELNIGRSFKWIGNRFHFEPRFVCEQAEPEEEPAP